MRRAARKDKNHTEIVQAFRSLCVSVADISRVGDGVPDLVVAANGKSALVEIKHGKGKLNAAQEEFQDLWQGLWFEVRSMADVEAVARELRK